MKPRSLFSLLLCASLLAGCYRQTEEPFQQVDSAEVVEAPAVIAAEGEVAGAEAGPAATVQRFITPEPLPGQIEQPTIAGATGEPAPAQTLTPFTPASPTLSFEEQLDPEDECVYQVQAGNVLFRLALAWNTTYQTIMEVNQLDSEDLSIGQLLLIPDCEPSEPEASPTDAPESANTAEAAGEPDAVDTTAPATAVEATVETPPEVHVVSAGETLESISLRYRVDVNELIALNELSSPDRLRVGQELKLPQ